MLQKRECRSEHVIIHITNIRSIQREEASASETAADLLNMGRITGMRAIRVRARADRVMIVASVPTPRTYPNGPGWNMDVENSREVISRRPRSCACTVTFLFRNGDVQIKYLNRSSNWVSSFSEDDAEKVSYKMGFFVDQILRFKNLFLAKRYYGSLGHAG